MPDKTPTEVFAGRVEAGGIAIDMAFYNRDCDCLGAKSPHATKEAGLDHMREHGVEEALGLLGLFSAEVLVRWYDSEGAERRVHVEDQELGGQSEVRRLTEGTELLRRELDQAERQEVLLRAAIERSGFEVDMGSGVEWLLVHKDGARTNIDCLGRIVS